MNDYEHLKGPTATLKRCTRIARDVDGCLAPPIDLPPWQLAAAIANRPKPPRIRQSLHRCRVMLRVNALVEPIVFHPGVFARLFKRHRAIASAYRAAEGLRSVVHAAQLAEMQLGITSADITPDPQGSEDLAKRAKGEGTIGPISNHGTRVVPVGSQRRIHFLPAVLARLKPATGDGYAKAGQRPLVGLTYVRRPSVDAPTP